MMLGKLALWRGALLVSRTQAFITGKGRGEGYEGGGVTADRSDFEDTYWVIVILCLRG